MGNGDPAGILLVFGFGGYRKRTSSVTLCRVDELETFCLVGLGG